MKPRAPSNKDPRHPERGDGASADAAKALNYVQVLATGQIGYVRVGGADTGWRLEAINLREDVPFVVPCWLH